MNLKPRWSSGYLTALSPQRRPDRNRHGVLGGPNDFGYQQLSHKWFPTGNTEINHMFTLKLNRDFVDRQILFITKQLVAGSSPALGFKTPGVVQVVEQPSKQRYRLICSP